MTEQAPWRQLDPSADRVLPSTLLGLAFVFPLGAIFVLAGGLVGAIGALVLLLVWARGTEVLAVAFGAICAGAILDPVPGSPVVLATGALLVGLLAPSAWDVGSPRAFLGALALALSALGLVGLLIVLVWSELWVVTVAIATTATLAAYYTHRYIRVVVGRHATLEPARNP